MKWDLKFRDTKYIIQGHREIIGHSRQCNGKESTCQSRRRGHGFDPWIGSPLEKGMTTHSNILAWRIPWTGEPDRLQSMGLQRVRHSSAHIRIHPEISRSGICKHVWRRERLPTPGFWPGEFYTVHGVAKSWTQLSDFHFTSVFQSFSTTPYASCPFLAPGCFLICKVGMQWMG